jgi:hypothetical protein
MTPIEAQAHPSPNNGHKGNVIVSSDEEPG